MKKVVKVSIANLAFTIEEDGYELFKSYLGELTAHYRSNPNGNEIIEGIEERIAELLLEKSGKEVVVTSSVVKEVINILGRPEMIDPDSEREQFTASSEKTGSVTPKKLYRDPNDKILGGVCSGLGAYTGIDRILVRVLFLVFFLGFSTFGFHMGGGGFVLLTYIVLWIIVPEARTVQQRCAMYGDRPDLSNIQKRVEDGIDTAGKRFARQNNRSEVVNTIFGILVKIFAVILIFIALSGLVTLSFLLLGVEIFQGLIAMDMFDYISLGLNNPFWLKLSLVLVMLLPLVGMLYGGIQALFNFKTRRIKVGLIIFLLWIISLFTFIGFSVKASTPYWSSAEKEITLPVRNDLDTLYVKMISPAPMPDSKVMLKADISDVLLFWFDNQGGQRDFVAFPLFNIVRQSETETPQIKCEINTMGNTYTDAQIKGERLSSFFELKDSLLVINADVINRMSKWDGTIKEISLYIPERVKVIVQEPVRHDFTEYTSKSIFKGDFRRHRRDFCR